VCRQIFLVSKDSSQIISRISVARLEKVHVTGVVSWGFEEESICPVRKAL
jgi:hypothetical protein